jgi:hypothetical protein
MRFGHVGNYQYALPRVLPVTSGRDPEVRAAKQSNVVKPEPGGVAYDDGSELLDKTDLERSDPDLKICLILPANDNDMAWPFFPFPARWWCGS